MRMRIAFTLGFATILASGAVHAGNLSFVNSQAVWQSTKCTEPAAPQSLVAAKSDTAAENMNVLMTQYNAYAGQMQEYMNCLSGEAENDSSVASSGITQSAQTQISAAQAKVESMRAAVAAQKKK